jgi:putative membrane protein
MRAEHVSVANPMNAPARRTPRISVVLTLILAAYASARLLEVVPHGLPSLAIVALNVLSSLAFALIDGARHYRVRGILVFAAICALIGNIAENLGISTGFPFGHYYFTSLMGPKLFQVPVLLGLAYIGMAYISWTLARQIAGSATHLLTVPITGSFIMVAWDLAQDPVWGTVLHGWVWIEGGPWFGVPISNYFGWYATVFVMYLVFALYLGRNRQALSATANGVTARPAIVFYALCAIGNILQTLRRADPAVVQDPSGHSWRVADISAASALISIFAMGAFAVFAWTSSSRPARD